jgi:hypothetical protein
LSQPRDIGAGDFLPYGGVLVLSMGEAISSGLAATTTTPQETLGGV